MESTCTCNYLKKDMEPESDCPIHKVVFDGYQVDGPEYPESTPVAELTKLEAMRELCNAIDYIEELEEKVDKHMASMNESFVNWRKGVRVE